MRKIRTIIPVMLTMLILGIRSAALYALDDDISRGDDYKKDIQTRIVDRIALPKGYHEGLFYDGEYIWVTNGKGINTWIIDPSSGSILSMIKPVGSFTEGLAEAGEGYLYLADWDEKKLFKVSIKKETMSRSGQIDFAPARPTGVVRIGGDTYVITWTRGLGTKYHLLKLDSSGNILGKVRIKDIHEPAHMAWDGEHLWITSWYSQRVYKVDLESLRIIGEFRSPVSKTTGITWDGKYFWLTGTYSDLYRVEVIE
ncbi:MAG: hypothetical protein GF409_05195 [Candidatus Omnitrophica bacterium]|nr:hypothetical protein [Candidatus Omnitrophota bacterium]